MFNVRASAVALTVHLMIIAKVDSCCFYFIFLLVSTLKVRAVALLLIRMDGASLTSSEPFVLTPSPTSTFVHKCFTTSDLSQMTQSRDVHKIYNFYRKKPDFLSSRVDPREARNQVGRCDFCPPSTPFPPFEITWLFSNGKWLHDLSANTPDDVVSIWSARRCHKGSHWSKV